MAELTIHPPLIITSRLLPGFTLDGVTVSVEPTGQHDAMGKPQWGYTIDHPERTGWYARDLHGPTDHRDAVRTLLSFLTAFAEAVEYETRTGREAENSNLFPTFLKEWATQNSDELAMLEWELTPEDER